MNNPYEKWRDEHAQAIGLWFFYPGILKQVDPPVEGEHVYVSNPTTPATRKTWARGADGTTREIPHVLDAQATRDGFRVTGNKHIGIYPQEKYEVDCEWVEGRPDSDHWQGKVKEKQA